MFPAFDEIHWYVEGVVNISLETHVEGGAVATTSGNSSAVLIDGRHGGAEMDRGTLPAALGYEKLDERAIAGLSVDSFPRGWRQLPQVFQPSPLEPKVASRI